MRKILIFISVFVLCLTFSLPVFAQPVTDFSSLPSVPSSEYDYFIYEDSSSDVYIMYSNDAKRIFRQKDGYIVFDAPSYNSAGWHFEYKLDNGSWVMLHDNTTNVQVYNICSADKVIYSSFDIKNYDDTVFFQRGQYLTMAERILEISHQKVLTEKMKLDGTMKTLVLCGVGCLASLMAFPILFKVLSRFQVR